MEVLRSLCGRGLLDYKTEKYVLIKNRRVGALQRVLQLGILGYVVGWSLVFKRGYQETASDPRVSVITKLKGVSVAQAGVLEGRVWDEADYTQPPQGEAAFFLVTNFLATPEQVQGACPEHPSVPLAPCISDEDCPAGEILTRSHGAKTGKCVRFNATYDTCEIRGWCPVESGDGVPRKPRLQESENVTLFIKNSIAFPEFRFFKTNTLETQDGAYFKGCRYDAASSPLCPVFRVRDVVEAAGADFEVLARLVSSSGPAHLPCFGSKGEYRVDLGRGFKSSHCPSGRRASPPSTGGVVRIEISWDCDLDRPGSECEPRYAFWLQEMGYNFRTATRRWRPPGVEARTLLKLFGIRFEVSVAGQAGKFSVVSAGITLGSGMALLGLATFLCDLLLLYVDGEAPLYRGTKFEEAKAPKARVEPPPPELASAPLPGPAPAPEDQQAA
ncbi:P2X purinoceptor 6 [Monodelphis domestica]|uniref:P2X purinoceptor 6 n=1 Tax=Monodelphis domestica TaxID=13616 RepID=UPI0024E19AB6|nr:P2X purinoceptor 6 [Monodelphis domestica]